MTNNDLADVNYPAFLRTLAEKLHATAKADTVFGEPREAQGRTMIPVARVAYGLGGGYGRQRRDGEGEAETPQSGGGGITIKPLGVIQITADSTRFIPLRGRKINLLAGLTAGLAACILITRSLVR